MSGLHHPFTNAPPQIEAHVEFIVDLIRAAGTNGVVEATGEADRWWTDLSNEIARGSIFHGSKSWIFEDNVAGMQHSTISWFGRLKAYREHLERLIRSEYKGYPFGQVQPM